MGFGNDNGHAELCRRADAAVIGHNPVDVAAQHPLDFLRLDVSCIVRRVEDQLDLLLREVPRPEHVYCQESVLKAGHVHGRYEDDHSRHFESPGDDIIEGSWGVQDHIVMGLG